MQAIFTMVLLIIIMAISYRIGKRKGYSGVLFAFLTTICPIMPIIALVLPNKAQDRAEAVAQQRKMEEMNRCIRELEQMQQKPAEKKAPVEKKAPAETIADIYTQGMQFYQQKEYYKAYPLLEKAAQRGHVKAQYTLGIMHRYGQGCKLDEEEALRWLEIAGEKDQLEAQKACASMYTVEKRDTKKALYWYEKAAEQGDAESQYAVAFYKRDNPEEARYWAEKAAEQGHKDARTLLNQFKPTVKTQPKPAEMPKEETVKQSQPAVKPEPVRSRSEKLTEEEQDIQMSYIEGVKAYDMGLSGVALISFIKSAKKGHLKSQMYCGQIQYDNGNYEQALYWYERAAEQGQLVAQQNCAAMYSNGEGCTPDPEKVLYWYEKAAGQGDDNAQLKVGMMYELGRGTGIDREKAYYWYKKAAAQGNERAQKLLQDMPAEKAEPKPTSELNRTNITAELAALHHHALSAYGRKEYFVALEWFEKVAKAGHTEAQMYCAQMYYRGQGCEVDYEQAFYWYEQAAAQGARTAQANLGNMYQEGKGCEVDYEKSFYWYEKAAEQGDVNAQLWTGMLYELGRGCTEDVKKARYWYEKAAAQGNENAKKLLSKMNN